MLHKTQGIVLGVSPYNDIYGIVQVFTRDFGRVSYLLPRSYGKKSKLKMSLFFPLSVLDLEVEHLPLRELHRLKEAERQFPLYDLCTNMTKISVAFFLSEFLSRVLRESDHNESAFDFMKNSVEALEAAEKGVANFHLAFMFGLTRFLGIYPNVKWEGKHRFFDLMHGEFVKNMPQHSHYLNGTQSDFLVLLQRMNYSNMHLFRLSRNNRNTIVDYLLEYYRLHIYDFPPLKSIDILRELA
ncbi:DNA repair protein RecO [Proteiniphilum sp. UBA1028]|jgi:DNA repair protein RecO (recombination protein O)|uniref:DNA repair protein RecO n=1 Tax=Proteiniphilum sp. UBA1028 TaxID=1947251 RepID=UPI0025F48BF0|nr:DNA repair protein RecO [Proteiniphilum sp. UBA1028]